MSVHSMMRLFLDLWCAAVFKLATLALSGVPQVTKAIIDTQYMTDVERASQSDASLLDLDASTTQQQPTRRATQCMCGCWRSGLFCPVVCLRSCRQLSGLRCKRATCIASLSVVLLYLFGTAVITLIWHWGSPWPVDTEFQASKYLPPATIESDAAIDLRMQMLRYLDQNPSICGAAAADIRQYASYILLRVGEASHHASCPAFAARCSDDQVIFEMFNPRLIDHTEHAQTPLARSLYQPSALTTIRTVKTQSLLCPTPCTREETFNTPVTVVFTSRQNSLHTLELRDQVAICFQHHLRVAQGEWPCAPCLETTPKQ